jgi:hypothetical protein
MKRISDKESAKQFYLLAKTRMEVALSPIYTITLPESTEKQFLEYFSHFKKEVESLAKTDNLVAVCMLHRDMKNKINNQLLGISNSQIEFAELSNPKGSANRFYFQLQKPKLMFEIDNSI